MGGSVYGDGKHAWFRLASTNCDQAHGDLGDGYPSYQPGHLTELHQLIARAPDGSRMARRRL